MTEHEKLTQLAYCLAKGWHEDAAGHLCDLLDHCRRKIVPAHGKPFKTLRVMVAAYGQSPQPIDDDGNK